MKGIILIAGHCNVNTHVMPAAKKIIEETLGKKCVLLDVTDTTDPNTVLAKTLELVRTGGPNSYDDTIVLYEGINAYMLEPNLPCRSLDIFLLKLKLTEVIGGYDKPRQKEMVDALFAGSVVEIVKENPNLN